MWCTPSPSTIRLVTKSPPARSTAPARWAQDAGKLVLCAFISQLGVGGHFLTRPLRWLSAQLWDSETGKCFHTFRGHTAEIVCLAFNSQSTMLASGSMDKTARLWDIASGEEIFTLAGHTAEIIAISFSRDGQLLLTASFDNTAILWDARTGHKVHSLIGHHSEISSACISFDSCFVLTGSIDKTARLWEVRSGKCVATLRYGLCPAVARKDARLMFGEPPPVGLRCAVLTFRCHSGHEDDLLDVTFNTAGSMFVTTSADGTGRVYSCDTFECLNILSGHTAEIVKVCFNPQGTRILTASADKSARVWDAFSGVCLQVLEGHTEELFCCGFNYEGDTALTGKRLGVSNWRATGWIISPQAVISPQLKSLAHQTRRQQGQHGSPVAIKSMGVKFSFPDSVFLLSLCRVS